MTMVSINVGEWLIARGEIHAGGGLREINAYLLGRDGPFLTPGQCDWIAQLRARPLRLYRVTDVQPGVGMTLIDEFDPQAPPQSVREISGSRTAKPGMLMGARIMEVAAGPGIAGHFELSGAIYPFAKLAEAAVLAQARQVLAGSAGMKVEGLGAALPAALQHPTQLRDDDADVRHDACVLRVTTGALRRHAAEHLRPLAGRGAQRDADGPTGGVASTRFIPGLIPEPAPPAGYATLTTEGGRGVLPWHRSRYALLIDPRD